VIQWWIYASFAVHDDMCSNILGIMTLGHGAVYASSMRQKLNTKILTEAELAGVNDLIRQTG